MGSEEAASVAGNGGAGHELADGVDDRRGLAAGGPDAAASAAKAAGSAGGSSGSERAVDDRLQGAVRTGDWVWLCPLTVQDAHSRYLLGCAGHRQVSGPATRATLKVFREHGLPERLRSDYGSPFTSVGAGRLSKLAAWWLRLGIELERIQPGKPQQNGRHERMHRVLKAETARPAAANRRRQQERFERFRDEYNLVRPHEALGKRTPASAHARSPREYPERVPDPEYPLHWERRRVRRDGSLKFQGRQPHLSEALVNLLDWSRSRRNCGRSGSATTRWPCWTPLRGSSRASAPLDAARRPSKPPWKLLKRNPSARIKV